MSGDVGKDIVEGVLEGMGEDIFVVLVGLLLATFEGIGVVLV